VSTHAAPAESATLARLRPRALPRVGAGTLTTVGLAALLVAVALVARGGLQLGPLTTVEIGVDAGAGALGAVAVLAGGAVRRPWGMATLGLMAGLAILTALSIAWSVDPADSWVEANRTLSYVAVFAAGVALVRVAPERWPSLLGATVLAGLTVSAYALATKVFPGALNPDEVYARLREPFGYWNAVGLMAALAAPGCLWLGSRRTGHAALNALAYPALGLLLVTILLAYSRGSLLALVVGCGFWFAVVPLRLRGIAVLATSAAGALLASVWAFGQRGLSQDRIDLAERSAAGHEFGLLLVAMVVVLLAAGLGIGFALAQRAPSPATRRQLGVAVLVCLGLVPVALVGSLAMSQRGLGGSISKGWSDLTDPSASTPANTADRLTAVGSVRARYWHEALQIFKAHKVAGVGAGGYATVRPRYRQDTLDVRHAHGYVVQTLADLGLAGLAVSLALLAAWLAAAARTTGPWRGARTGAFGPERVGMLTLAAIVVTFGVHSFVDWTWFVPGNAVLALLCAGWVAARGPLAAGMPATVPLIARVRGGARDPRLAALAAAAVLVGLVGAWTAFQPQRSVDAGDSSLTALEQKDLVKARADADHARRINPLSVEPLYDRSAIELSAGHLAAARAALEDAVNLQPSNPEPWQRLAEFELDFGNRPRAALNALGPALYLDPRSPSGQALFLQATRETGATP
jgi:O-Antigen ligase